VNVRNKYGIWLTIIFISKYKVAVQLAITVLGTVIDFLSFNEKKKEKKIYEKDKRLKYNLKGKNNKNEK